MYTHIIHIKNIMYILKKKKKKKKRKDRLRFEGKEKVPPWT